jgi:hypothetical protein
VRAVLQGWDLTFVGQGTRTDEDYLTNVSRQPVGSEPDWVTAPAPPPRHRDGAKERRELVVQLLSGSPGGLTVLRQAPASSARVAVVSGRARISKPRRCASDFMRSFDGQRDCRSHVLKRRPSSSVLSIQPAHGRQANGPLPRAISEYFTTGTG